MVYPVSFSDTKIDLFLREFNHFVEMRRLGGLKVLPSKVSRSEPFHYLFSARRWKRSGVVVGFGVVFCALSTTSSLCILCASAVQK